ncbi:MAG: hypothetical protein HY711_08475 [Candidatus Melainabacteria bacterium]|nr:hypothetical protein [Candidatus Melainabacteria bacterium]
MIKASQTRSWENSHQYRLSYRETTKLMQLSPNIFSPCLALVLSLMTALPGQTNPSKADEKPPDKLSTQSKKPGDSPATSSALASTITNFKLNPNDVTWSSVSQAFKSWLISTPSAWNDTDTLVKANPSLVDLGVKIINAGAAKVWLFPRISQSHELYIHCVETKIDPSKGRRRTTHTITTPRVQVITIAPSVSITGARVISSSSSNHHLDPSQLKLPAGRRVGKSQSKTSNITSQRFLIVTGSDQSGTIWLKSYRLGFDGWKEDPYPVSGIPPFLLTNLSGQISLTGSDLVLTINQNGNKTPQAFDTSAHAEPSTGLSAYQLVLRLINGRYTLDGKDIEDSPVNAVREFVAAVLQKRLDIAKGWLVDPRLVSIAKYIGLTAGKETSSLRILGMSCTTPTIYRYRLITYQRNDLIFDVTKSKSWWAIKGIFIAPADPLLQKLAKNLPCYEVSMTNPPITQQEKKSATCPEGTIAPPPTNRLTSEK